MTTLTKEKQILENQFSWILILSFFLLIFTTSPALAELKIESVYPNQGVLGQDLAVTLKGKGFDENTRVMMSLDLEVVGSTTESIQYAEAVAVMDDIAYVIYEERYDDNPIEWGLWVIDTSNFNIIGSLPMTGKIYDSFYDIKVAGNMAYITACDGGLKIVDISDPTTPNMFSSVNVESPFYYNSYFQSVFVVNDMAYVAGNKGFAVIDISDDMKPEIINSIDISKSKNVAISGETAYVTTSKGLHVIDISDVANLKTIGLVDIPGLDGWGIRGNITVSGDNAYVAAGDSGIQVIDISNKTNPQIIGSLDTGFKAFDVQIVDNTAYAGTQYGSFKIIDISIPSDPQIIKNLVINGPVNESIKDIAILNDKAYMAAYRAGFQVMDLTNPSDIELTSSGSYKPSVDTEDVVIVGNTVYLADRNKGFQIIDVSNPSDPKAISSVSLPGTSEALGITVAENTAYLVAYYDDKYAGLYVIDISEPENPKIIGSETSESYYTITVAGDQAYVSCSGFEGYRLKIIDISDSANPKTMGSVKLSNKIKDVAVAGDYAFAAVNDGLQVIDIKDPSDPKIIGNLDGTWNGMESLTIKGDMAYISGSKNFQIIDISDPANPKQVGSAVIQGSGYDVVVAGELAYVAGHYEGLEMIEISDPANPLLLGIVKTKESGSVLAVEGELAYMACGNDGLLIFPLPREIKPVTVNSETEIVVTLPTPAMAGDFRLKVFNTEEDNEMGWAVNFSKLDLADIDPNNLAILTMEGEAVPETVEQGQLLDLKLVYKTPYGIPFNLSNLPDVLAVEWLSANPSIMSIDGAYNADPGSFIAESAGSSQITAQTTIGKASVTVNVQGTPAADTHGNLIIVSGRKSVDEELSYYINGISNSVYQTFYNRGFSHEDIYYFSSYEQSDLTVEDVDIVDREVGFEESTIVTELNDSIINWAAQKENLGPLYIFLVDHGAPQQFMINPKSKLSATQLNGALNSFQADTGRQVIIVIEACYSGSWVSALEADDRIIIASTGSEHAENLPTDSLISFSDYFFKKLARGMSFNSAFSSAKNTIQELTYATNQTPQMDYSGMSIYSTYLVGGFASEGEPPLFVEYTGKETSLTVASGTVLYLESALNIPYPDGFEVWASLVPPVPASGAVEDFQTPTVSSIKVELGYIGYSDFQAYFDGNKHYDGLTPPLDQEGIYDLTFYARNISGQIIHSDHVPVVVQGGNPSISDYTFEIDIDGDEKIPSQLAEGEVMNLTLTASKEGMDPIDISEFEEPLFVQWFSSNPGVISVDSNGTVTAKDAGSAKITAVGPGWIVSTQFLVLGAAETKEVGNLILLAGREKSNEPLAGCFGWISNKVYSTFYNRGFDHDTIYYFNAYGDQTLPGQSDNIVDRIVGMDETDIADEVTDAVTNWAVNQDKTGPLYVYLIDHGAEQEIMINPKASLSAQALDSALDTFQAQTGRQVFVIIEACYSGSWVELLKNDNRIIMSSAQNKSEIMPTYGAPSFSSFLLKGLSKGDSFKTAFENSALSISEYTQKVYSSAQSPQFYSGNADLWGDSLVGSFATAAKDVFSTYTGQIEPAKVTGGTSLNLTTQIDFQSQNDLEVFAVITPPQQGIPQNLQNFETPVAEQIKVTLTSQGQDIQSYTGQTEILFTPGNYGLTFYVKDASDELYSSSPTYFEVEWENDQEFHLVNGWNLLGSRIGFDVSKVFSNGGTFTSLWKWENSKWAVYLPSMSQEDAAAYITNKGFNTFTNVIAGEGFWVNTVQENTLTIGGEISQNSSIAMQAGWNLIGLKSNATKLITTLIPENEDNIASVWKWEGSNWAVYLPGENDGGDAYAKSKGFALLSNIEPGEGFWVNCSEAVILD